MEKMPCGNPEYVENVRDFLEGELFSQPGFEEWTEDDPRSAAFIEQAQVIIDETTGVRMSCAKFTVGVNIESGLTADSLIVTPNLSNRPCMLAPNESCPIEAQVQALRDKHGEVPVDDLDD